MDRTAIAMAHGHARRVERDTALDAEAYARASELTSARTAAVRALDEYEFLLSELRDGSERIKAHKALSEHAKAATRLWSGNLIEVGDYAVRVADDMDRFED